MSPCCWVVGLMVLVAHIVQEHCVTWFDWTYCQFLWLQFQFNACHRFTSMFAGPREIVGPREMVVQQSWNWNVLHEQMQRLSQGNRRWPQIPRSQCSATQLCSRTWRHWELQSSSNHRGSPFWNCFFSMILRHNGNVKPIFCVEKMKTHVMIVLATWLKRRTALEI